LLTNFVGLGMQEFKERILKAKIKMELLNEEAVVLDKKLWALNEDFVFCKNQAVLTVTSAVTFIRKSRKRFKIDSSKFRSFLRQDDSVGHLTRRVIPGNKGFI
jgi:hypothetical protein